MNRYVICSPCNRAPDLSIKRISSYQYQDKGEGGGGLYFTFTTHFLSIHIDPGSFIKMSNLDDFKVSQRLFLLPKLLLLFCSPRRENFSIMRHKMLLGVNSNRQNSYKFLSESWNPLDCCEGLAYL